MNWTASQTCHVELHLECELLCHFYFCILLKFKRVRITNRKCPTCQLSPGLAWLNQQVWCLPPKWKKRKRKHRCDCLEFSSAKTLLIGIQLTKFIWLGIWIAGNPDKSIGFTVFKAYNFGLSPSVEVDPQPFCHKMCQLTVTRNYCSPVTVWG